MGTPPTPTPPRDPTIRSVAQPPNYKIIGAQEWRGKVEAGFLKDIGKLLESAFRVVAGWLLTGLFGIGAWIIGTAVETIIAVEAEQGETMERLASLAIQDLFNLPEAPRVGGARGAGAGRTEQRAVIGRAIRNALLAELPIGRQLTPDEGVKNAEKLLDTVSNIAIEGWFEGMVIESASVGFIRGFTELDDTLANILGLGRLVRAGLRPYIEASIATPLEWAVNKATTPRIFGPAEAARAVARGIMTKEAYLEEMARQGWSAPRAEHLLAVNQRSPGIADIAEFVRFGALTFEEGKKLLTDDGWEEKVADLVLRSEVSKRLAPLKEAIASVAITMYAEREITSDELLRLLVGADYTNPELQLARALGDLRRARPRRLSIGQVSEAFSTGLIDISIVRDWIDDEAYTERDALIIEQLLLKRKITDEELERRRQERLERERQRNRN